MTKKFDTFVESLLKEYTSAKSRRNESRYWAPTMFPGSEVRKVATMRDKNPSQRTKLGNQQYVGSILGKDGLRGRNKSEKDLARIGIGKGLGNHLRIQGVNARKPGSRVNSKQGNMEIKYTMDNGVAKVGSTGKTDYSFTEPKHSK